jgi:hypothetical protein
MIIAIGGAIIILLGLGYLCVDFYIKNKGNFGKPKRILVLLLIIALVIISFVPIANLLDYLFY